MFKDRLVRKTEEVFRTEKVRQGRERTISYLDQLFSDVEWTVLGESWDAAKAGRFTDKIKVSWEVEASRYTIDLLVMFLPSEARRLNSRGIPYTEDPDIPSSTVAFFKALEEEGFEIATEEDEERPALHIRAYRPMMEGTLILVHTTDIENW